MQVNVSGLDCNMHMKSFSQSFEDTQVKGDDWTLGIKGNLGNTLRHFCSTQQRAVMLYTNIYFIVTFQTFLLYLLCIFIPR